MHTLAAQTWCVHMIEILVYVPSPGTLEGYSSLIFWIKGTTHWEGFYTSIWSISWMSKQQA